MLLLAGLLLGAGCGGGSKPASTPAGGGADVAAQAGAGDSGMIPPETLEDVNRAFERRRPILSRCLAIAVDNKELPKNSSGKVTVEVVIAPSGTAESVKIVRATLQSKLLDECVINRVKEIAFPQLPRRFETSFIYGFEAM